MESLTRSQFTQELNQIKANIKEAIDVMEVAGERFNADKMLPDSTNWRKNMESINKEISAMEKRANEWNQTMTQAPEYGAYDALINKFKDLRHILEDGQLSEAEYKNALAELKLEASTLVPVLEKLHKADQEFMKPGSQASDQAISRIIKLRDAAQKMLGDFTAAEHGQSSKDYAAIKGVVSGLDEMEAKLTKTGE